MVIRSLGFHETLLFAGRVACFALRCDCRDIVIIHTFDLTILQEGFNRSPQGRCSRLTQLGMRILISPATSIEAALADTCHRQWDSTWRPTRGSWWLEPRAYLDFVVFCSLLRLAVSIDGALMSGWNKDGSHKTLAATGQISHGAHEGGI